MKIIPLFTTIDIYFFIIFAVIIGITGIVILIIGISRKKVGVWVTAIFILLVALILGVTGVFLGVRKVLSDPDFGRGKKYTYRWDNDKKAANVDKSFTDDMPDDFYTLKANAVMFGSEGKAELVQVLAAKKINKRGIFIESSDSLLENRELDDNFIYLNMRFNKSYRGYIHLKAFDKNKNGLARSEVEIDINDSLTLQLAFHLEDDFDFSDVEYCTISTQKE